MCGLVGQFGLNESGSFDFITEAVEPYLSRRGPDQQNSFSIDEFGVRHARLVVRGQGEDGMQPLRYRDWVIVYNGNLYNSEELRSELMVRGHVLEGTSDTPVFAAAFDEWGVCALPRFNGFFAAAIYNVRNHELFLVRDKHGQKPLYFSASARSVHFGSTLHMMPSRLKERLRPEAAMDLLCYGFLPAPTTMYAEIEALEPAHYVHFRKSVDGTITGRIERFWRPEFIPDEIGAVAERTQAALETAIKHVTIADAPGGCLLSGGVDSSLVYALLRRGNFDRVAPLTVDFAADDQSGVRASNLAQAFADDSHVTLNLDYEEGAALLPALGEICDQPFDDTSIVPATMIFGRARALGYKMVLTGDAADELFGGYQSFTRMKTTQKFLHPSLDSSRKWIWRHLRSLLRDPQAQWRLYRAFLPAPELLADIMSNGLKSLELETLVANGYDPRHHVRKAVDANKELDPLSMLRMLNLTFKLPNQMLYKIDRASMYNAVEARPIFLHDAVVDVALSLSNQQLLAGGSKSVLRDVCASILPTDDWRKPKIGFGWRTDKIDALREQIDIPAIDTFTGTSFQRVFDRRPKEMRKRWIFLGYGLSQWLHARSA